MQPNVPSPATDPAAGLRPNQIIVIDPNNKEETGKYLPESIREEVEKSTGIKPKE